MKKSQSTENAESKSFPLWYQVSTFKTLASSDVKIFVRNIILLCILWPPAEDDTCTVHAIGGLANLNTEKAAVIAGCAQPWHNR